MLGPRHVEHLAILSVSGDSARLGGALCRKDVVLVEDRGTRSPSNRFFSHADGALINPPPGSGPHSHVRLLRA